MFTITKEIIAIVIRIIAIAITYIILFLKIAITKKNIIAIKCNNCNLKKVIEIKKK